LSSIGTEAACPGTSFQRAATGVAALLAHGWRLSQRLTEETKDFGYDRLPARASPLHTNMCEFLFENGMQQPVVGPADCYA